MDRRESFQSESSGNAHDMLSDAASRVREDVERLVDGFDFQTISRRVEDFGKENPVGLALTALVLGVAVGLLMRNSTGMNEPRQELNRI